MNHWTTDFEHLLRRHCRFLAPEQPIDPDVRFAALGVDSVTFLALMVDVEARFFVVVPQDLLVESDTPGGLWRVVEGLTEKQHGGVQ